MGPWTSHGQSYYNCNRYDDKDAIEARDAQTKSRADLERYLHVIYSFKLIKNLILITK